MTTRIVAGSAGFVLAGLGMVVMAGWYADSATLVRLHASWAPMPFNEALCFAVLGAALIAGACGLRLVCATCGAVVVLIAGATFIQYVFALEFRIDELFVEAWARAPLTPRGRMAAGSAAVFMLMGAALMPEFRERGRQAAAMGAWAAGVVAVIVGAAYGLGYLPSVRPVADLLGWSRVALHACAAFMLAGAIMVALAGPWTRGANGAARSRRWATLLFMLVAIAGVNLWQALVSSELARGGADAGRAARGLANIIYNAHTDRHEALAHVAASLADGGMRAGWEHELRDHALPALPGATWVAVVGADGRALAAAGAATPRPDLSALRRALETMEPATTARQLLAPFTSDAGQLALVAEIDYAAAYEPLLKWVLPGYSFELTIDDTIVFERKADGDMPTYHPYAGFVLPDAVLTPRWGGTIWRPAHTVEGHRGVLPLAVLLLSLVAAGLVAHAFRATARLRTQLEIDRAIWRNSHDVLCAVDKDGRFVRVSDAAREVWGYEPSELVGKSHLVVSVPEARDEAADVVTERQQVQRFQSLALRRDGTTVPMSWSTVWSDELKVMVAIGRDVTEQARYEEELERRVAERTHELTLANAELEAFSYSVSHDLRTPLRAIAGFTELLRDGLKGQLDETAQHYFRRVMDGTTRMAQLIDDLLRLGRLSRLDLERVPMDLSAAATEIADRLRAAEPNKPVEFHILPGMTASADPHLMELVLENLFGNAWKFTRDRDPAVIEFTQKAGVFSIRDNGVGFDMQYAGSLFGVFQRLHGIDEFPGTGIGLATVKRIVERHGGEVWAHGEIGQGAEFRFTLG